MSGIKSLQELKKTKYGDTAADMIYALTEVLERGTLPKETRTLVLAVLEKAGIAVKPYEKNDAKDVIMYVKPVCSCGSDKVILNIGHITTPDDYIPVYSLCCEDKDCLRFTGACSSPSDLIDQWIKFEGGSFVLTDEKSEYANGIPMRCTECGTQLVKNEDYISCLECERVFDKDKKLKKGDAVDDLLLQWAEDELVSIVSGGYGG